MVSRYSPAACRIPAPVVPTHSCDERCGKPRDRSAVSQSVEVFKIKQGAPKEPIPFKIEVELLNGETVAHDFTAHNYEDDASAGMFLATFAVPEVRTLSDTLRILLHFFKVAMPADDYRRLVELTEDPDVRVPMETFTAIHQMLSSRYYKRPTQRSSTSSDGRPAIDTSSTAPQSSEG
jgi:hypothetical protein